MKRLLIGGLAAILFSACSSGDASQSDSFNQPRDNMMGIDMKGNPNDISDLSNNNDGDLTNKLDMAGDDGKIYDMTNNDLLDAVMNRKDPPTIELVGGPSNVPYDERTVKATVVSTYTASVKSPYNGQLSCTFDFSDGFKSPLDQKCGVDHALAKIGDYMLVSKVTDNASGLTASRNTLIHAIDPNSDIPPVAVLDCTSNEYDHNDGLCVFRVKVNDDLCINGTKSYDVDGNITEYRFYDDVNGCPGCYNSIYNPKNKLCIQETIIGKVYSQLEVLDDSMNKGNQFFYVITSN